MRVLLLRHAEAIETHLAPSDGTRWLSEAGRESIGRVAGALKEHGLRFERVFTSPLVRAVQTAEILAAGTGFTGPVEAVVALAGGTNAQAVDAIAGSAVTGDLALVGHEPSIRTLASHLGGIDLPPFRTAGACVVDFDGSTGRYLFRIDPHTLDRID